MIHPSARPNPVVIGIDVGDKKSCVCVMANAETTVRLTEIPTTPAAFMDFFHSLPSCSVFLETGSHALWIHQLLGETGHVPRVVDPRDPRLWSKRKKKNDRIDARKLAELGFLPRSFVSHLENRPPEYHRDLASVRARDELVKARTMLINTLRGLVKPFGHRIPKLDSTAVHKKALRAVPRSLWPTVIPILKSLREITRQIATIDRHLGRLVERRYPETQLLIQVYGVGAITALTYCLTLWNPKRFAKSRQVGAYVGLVPEISDSGGSTPQLGITKTGDPRLRRLLIQCAHTILRKGAPDSDLKRFGEALSTRGGKNARKRAVVAIARRLAGILHRLWLTGEVYDPFYASKLAATPSPN